MTVHKQIICPHCGASHSWAWEDAFDKFGFGDGDGIVMTHQVAQALRDNGYIVEQLTWGAHNVVITSIAKDGRNLIPDGVDLGYDNPRDYLPPEIIAILDEAFPGTPEVVP